MYRLQIRYILMWSSHNLKTPSNRHKIPSPSFPMIPKMKSAMNLIIIVHFVLILEPVAAKWIRRNGTTTFLVFDVCAAVISVSGHRGPLGIKRIFQNTGGNCGHVSRKRSERGLPMFSRNLAKVKLFLFQT
jgi:hypothetical protein